MKCRPADIGGLFAAGQSERSAGGPFARLDEGQPRELVEARLLDGPRVEVKLVQRLLELGCFQVHEYFTAPGRRQRALRLSTCLKEGDEPTVSVLVASSARLA